MMVRLARASDIPFIAETEKTVFSDPWSEKAVEEHLNADYTCAFVCEDGGIPCGYLLGSILPPESELYRVAVLPDRRKNGAGRALTAYYLDYAEKRGSPLSFLEVRESNIAALTLYASLGYVKTGVRKNYYRLPTESAVLMMRTAEKENG